MSERVREWWISDRFGWGGCVSDIEGISDLGKILERDASEGERREKMRVRCDSTSAAQKSLGSWLSRARAKMT
jgi:hypothetical protein